MQAGAIMKEKPVQGKHLRDAFCDWIYERTWVKPEINAKPVEVEWLLEALLPCSDIMPADICAELKMPKGSNYARAAKKLTAMIKRGKEPRELLAKGLFDFGGYWVRGNCRHIKEIRNDDGLLGVVTPQLMLSSRITQQQIGTALKVVQERLRYLKSIGRVAFG